MACARVQTNDGCEEKLMDGRGLGSCPVYIVTLLLGHCEFKYLYLGICICVYVIFSVTRRYRSDVCPRVSDG